jgi:hypothetical protein
METSNKRHNLGILKPLFWEYDWDSVQKNLTSPFVIARVLELGNPQQFHLFAELVGHGVIKSLLHEKGKELLSPQSFNFWRLYYQRNEVAEAT